MQRCTVMTRGYLTTSTIDFKDKVLEIKKEIQNKSPLLCVKNERRVEVRRGQSSLARFAKVLEPLRCQHFCESCQKDPNISDEKYEEMKKRES